MGAWGAIILGFFGSAFAALTMGWEGGIADARLALPFAVFAAIAVAAAIVLRQPGTGVAPSERAGRTIMWASIGEGVGLFLVSQIVLNLRRREWLLPAMALVVGLHFLPIARTAPFRPFYVLGGALVAAAAVGFALPPPTGGEVAGAGAAAALWLAAIAALRRDRLARRASG